MRIGDKIRHTKHQGFATIIKVNVETAINDFDRKVTTKVKYTARYDDTGYLLKFYGYDIGKTVFKHEPNEQLSMFIEL